MMNAWDFEPVLWISVRVRFFFADEVILIGKKELMRKKRILYTTYVLVGALVGRVNELLLVPKNELKSKWSTFDGWYAVSSNSPRVRVADVERRRRW